MKTPPYMYAPFFATTARLGGPQDLLRMYLPEEGQGRPCVRVFFCSLIVTLYAYRRLKVCTGCEMEE